MSSMRAHLLKKVGEVACDSRLKESEESQWRGKRADHSWQHRKMAMYAGGTHDLKLPSYSVRLLELKDLVLRLSAHSVGLTRRQVLHGKETTGVKARHGSLKAEG